jgi:hypothetical protein
MVVRLDLWRCLLFPHPVRPEDDLNVAVYNQTARELLGGQVGGDAGTAAGLKAFPQALGRYTVNPSNDQ